MSGQPLNLILPIPQNVIDYLLDDGTLVVSGSKNNNQHTQTNNSDSDEDDIQDRSTFRYTTSEVTVQPSPCLSYRIPQDFLDLSTGEDPYKLIDFLKLKRGQQEEEESEEEGAWPRL